MDFDKKLFEQVCKDYVLDSINTSKYLRSHLVLVEHAKIYEWTKNKASYKQIVSLIISGGDPKSVTKEAIEEFENLVYALVEAKPEYTWPPFKKAPAAIGRAGKAVGKFMSKERHPVKFMKKVAIASAIILAGFYLYKKLSDPCIRQCKIDRVCIKNCRVSAIKKTIANLQSHMGSCRDTPDPAKCQEKIKKEIAKWNDKIRKIESSK